MRDAWLRKATPRRPWTWAEVKRHVRGLRVPVHVCEILQQWGASPDDLKPLLRLIRGIVVSNAIHRAELKRATWAAGRARDPHYELTPEQPGSLRPLLDVVEQVTADLERLIQWRFTPPIVLHELDPKLKPTHRRVRLTRLDEALRETFGKAQQELLRVRANLRKDTHRPRGSKATLVQPYWLWARSRKPARRRELVRMVCAQILALHPNQKKPPRAARAMADRLAGDIIDSISVLN